MNHSFKLLINTGSSYLRIIANGIVSIIVTRIALNALGVDNFGLYNLLAGTIALLSFVNTALLLSSQRYFSIALGKNDQGLLQTYFSCSVMIHLLLSIIIAIILLLIQPILFHSLLNIKEDQSEVAYIIYQIMILSTCVTMNCVPFAALMNAYEDIAVLSFINIGSYIIRLLAAISLLFVNSNLLIIFSCIICLSILFKLISEFLWCKIKYKNICIGIRENFNKKICKEIFGFAGWNTLGAFSVIIRDEGVAVELNYYFGTAINASYGIANQVNSLVLSFAASLSSVFTPSIIQAKGAGNNDKMRFLSTFTSKLSFLLAAMMALPILSFLPSILRLWLHEVPNYTEIFCRYIILCFLIQMLYSGINRMIYAYGKIRNYQFGMFICFVSILPIGALLFHKLSNLPELIFSIMIVSQIGVLILTVYTAKRKCGLNLKEFFIHGILVPVIIFGISYWICNNLYSNISINYDLMTIIFNSIIIDFFLIITYYILVFNKTEKKQILILLNNIKSKLL